jgi:hypothetical protein
MTQKMLLVIMFAGAALGDSIPVTGSGTFSLDNFFDTGANLFFSGSSDAGSVSLFADSVSIGPAPPTTIFGTTFLQPFVAFISPGATIDGVHSSYWAFQLGQGPGYLELLDAAGNILMEQDITGYIQITSYQEVGGSRFNSNGNLNLNWSASGTFSIVPTPGSGLTPTPEPGSGLLVGLGILAALLFGRRNYAASARSR